MIVRGYVVVLIIVGIMIIMVFLRVGFTVRRRSIMVMAVIVFAPCGERQGYQQGDRQRRFLESHFGFHKKFPIFYVGAALEPRSVTR